MRIVPVGQGGFSEDRDQDDRRVLEGDLNSLASAASEDDRGLEHRGDSQSTLRIPEAPRLISQCMTIADNRPRQSFSPLARLLVCAAPLVLQTDLEKSPLS